MFFLYTDCGKKKFVTKAKLEEYIENGHAEKDSFDWICEIKDDKGNYYGCNWRLDVQVI